MHLWCTGVSNKCMVYDWDKFVLHDWNLTCVCMQSPEACSKFSFKLSRYLTCLDLKFSNLNFFLSIQRSSPFVCPRRLLAPAGRPYQLGLAGSSRPARPLRFRGRGLYQAFFLVCLCASAW